ncbi:hypothetical protein [Aquimarina rhabdastrellae]
MRKKAKRSFVEEWLIKNKDVIKVKPLERKLGFHVGVIQKFLGEQRTISDDRINTLYEFITKNMCDVVEMKKE